MSNLEPVPIGRPTVSGTSLSELMLAIRARTPARILAGRAGPAYLTATQLELRQDHAAAVDAVHAEMDLDKDFGQVFLNKWGLFEVRTCAASKAEFLMRPDLGRRLSDHARQELIRRCPAEVDFQIVIGDGLSVAAVRTQVPRLLPILMESAVDRGSIGCPFVVRYCRVGVLNDIGELLKPAVVALLIGERPGLATAESLSAYMAYHPRTGHNDANRNLISNIHARGIAPEDAAQRILALADKMRSRQASGVAIKEDLVKPDKTRSLPRL